MFSHNVEAVILKFGSFSSMENECVPLNRLTIGDLLIKILVLLVHGQYSLTAVRALCYEHEGSFESNSDLFKIYHRLDRVTKQVY